MLVLVALAELAWFAGPSGLLALVPLLAAAALALARAGMPGRGWWRRAHPETLACVALALAWRVPAIVHPWGWVNRDGAYGAFVALHLRQGLRPAPVFTEGANYQGTLKGHLAALFGVLGVDDLSRAMVLAGVVLHVALVVAAMALARRVGGRPAAAVTGVFLAVSSRFLTVFSLNAVGQYVDVLALGGLALAALAGLLDGDEGRAGLRARAAAAGWLLGAAFWQQPVALSYAAAGLGALALRLRSWRDGTMALALAGALVGALPVVVWNVQHDWASEDIMGRDVGDLKAQADALPRLARRAATISFPILAGVTPGHPWSEHPLARGAALALIPGAFLAYLLVTRGALRDALRGRPRAALLAPALGIACLLLFWAVAAGKVYWRPRYLLPVVAATAVHFGVSTGWLWARSRAAAAVLVAGVLSIHVAGTWPRLAESASIASFYRSIVQSLEQKGIRTGYADFSISAPVTMFTAERILLSAELGPTPAYESELHARKVREAGADAFVLPVEMDPAPFAAGLDALGVAYRFDPEPMPVFYALSRRVRVEEVRGFLGAAPEETE